MIEGCSASMAYLSPFFRRTGIERTLWVLPCQTMFVAERRWALRAMIRLLKAWEWVDSDRIAGTFPISQKE